MLSFTQCSHELNWISLPILVFRNFSIRRNDRFRTNYRMISNSASFTNNRSRTYIDTFSNVTRDKSTIFLYNNFLSNNDIGNKRTIRISVRSLNYWIVKYLTVFVDGNWIQITTNYHVVSHITLRPNFNFSDNSCWTLNKSVISNLWNKIIKGNNSFMFRWKIGFHNFN